LTDMSRRLAEVRGCRLCEASLPLGPKPILQYHPKARILIAGQAPGRRAHDSGIPFSDASGERLRGWLGVDRETFYDPKRIAILPMGFCYPGRGRAGDLPPRPECAEAWRKRLLSGLKQVRLTLVIGRYAVDWHLPDAVGRPLTEVIAGWERYWPKVLPMPHPSPRNQRWLRNNPWFEESVLPRLRKTIRELTDTSADSGGTAGGAPPPAAAPAPTCAASPRRSRTCPAG
jgi:uracil-DNA glycosylase